MAMKKCKECGKEISSSAKTCPNCGAKQGLSKGCLIFSIFAICLPIAFCVIVMISEDHPAPTQAKAEVERTPEMEKKFEEARTKLKESPKIDMLKDMDGNNRDGYQGPFVVVGPTFFEVDMATKRNFIDVCNTFFMAGRAGRMKFNVYEWRNGKLIGKNDYDGLELY